MNTKTRVQIINDAEKLLRKLDDTIGLLELNCLSCDHWNNDPEHCNKHAARPPAHIIVNGCKDHDNLPF